MEFRDKKERAPESYGYLIFNEDDLVKFTKKREEDKLYKPSVERVEVFENQKPKAYLYKIKLKDLDIGQGCYTDKCEWVTSRIE